jgi:GNAT superfamily N-acetyltransferase/uncharacterized protein YneR
MNLAVKKMSNEHIPFIYHIFEQNRAVLHGSYISLDEWTDYFANFDTTGGNDPYESHHIITADDILAAWLKINAWNKPEICISMLVVDDAFKHKGIGRFAVQFAENQARYWAKSAIRVQTTKDNTVAKNCYLKCGYEIVREMIYKVGDGVDREGYEFYKTILPEALTKEALKEILSKMLGEKIISADFQSKQLRGGTVGDVRLVSGNAETSDGTMLPYEIVLKVQKKWERPGDPDSWRREYDLYTSDLGSLFNDSLRWPKCYHAKMNAEETETQLWMEYIDGISGFDLNAEMFERSAWEIGRFQGRLYADRPDLLGGIQNLSKLECLKNHVFRSRNDNLLVYLRSGDCELSKHLRDMVIAENDNAAAIWARIENLPVVLCHRDFWYTNIFYDDGKIILIDWDSAGWGYMGEDVRQLLTDEMDIGLTAKYYQKCVSAYYKGLSEFADMSHIPISRIEELVLFNLAGEYAKQYMNAKTPEQQAFQIDALQKIYEMKNNYDR